MPATEAGPLGLLGGTFDPIHLGHLRLAEEAREALGLARVRLTPAGRPPHRDTPHCSSAHRLAMVRLAAAGNPAFEVDDSEIRAATPSYTVPTLERLRAELGLARPLVLILGADAFQGLPDWHRWEEIFTLAHVAVANRPGHAPHGRRWPGVLSPALDAACAGRIASDPASITGTPAGLVVPFDMTPLDISASLIRDLLAHGASARYLLPDSVLDYIGLHHLYRRN
ncbi:nicotinate-nucleotide adenylyltransferase [Pseudothauera rhizosphaerae]|uniref:Probable nicotinate-nucleotide adenylyltransferase n=1 Tax=Pseudothauera rhizosphaerae TaxID=2565932 RepID=A0A4S4B084_9RHOO|nr:nicotinate-nucleotide adenylyltransferase [Pseudothauera rhizosphaerae]THF65034.1 nicotinate-nucleotide adenylyltransferase [Pseudothauera rhizosphaerae]